MCLPQVRGDVEDELDGGEEERETKRGVERGGGGTDGGGVGVGLDSRWLDSDSGAGVGT